MAAEVSKSCPPPSIQEDGLRHAEEPVALLASGGGGLWEAIPEGGQLSREPYIYYVYLADLSQTLTGQLFRSQQGVGGSGPGHRSGRTAVSMVSLALDLATRLNTLFSLVLYDACPKSLRSGVWWPQTKFGVLATVPCPRGALGECVVGSVVAEGGAGLFSDRYSRLFHRVGWSYLCEEMGVGWKSTRAP